MSAPVHAGIHTHPPPWADTPRAVHILLECNLVYKKCDKEKKNQDILDNIIVKVCLHLKKYAVLFDVFHVKWLNYSKYTWIAGLTEISQIYFLWTILAERYTNEVNGFKLIAIF